MVKRKLSWAIVFGLLTTALVFGLNHRFGKVPALAKFLSPFSGVWQNAEKSGPKINAELKLDGLKAPVSIYYDERYVPHIFAENDEDLYFAQGYVQAQFRLWQMDFQTTFAGGGLSEILGEVTLPSDRYMRRIGLPMAAEVALESMQKDPEVFAGIQAMTAGINAYIDQLKPQDYPVEYKLIGHAPKKWSEYRTALVLKNMAHGLASYDFDVENNAARSILGADLFKEVYRMHWPNDEPIVPGFEVHGNARNAPTPTPMRPTWKKAAAKKEDAKYKYGSNNWAVSGSRTASGRPILAGDPHLQLTYPSVWLEMHLNSPSHNVYGVCLPGAPGVIIGFNDYIAWSLTNGERDVRDWYHIKYKDESENEYWHDNKWKAVGKRVEEIKVRGAKTVYDTVRYTHHGPVTYDQNFGDMDDARIASRWMAHLPSNESKTLQLMNRAKNYEDYRAAIPHFRCPAQNIVFASVQGDIAISHAGHYPIMPLEKSMFVVDGSLPENDWTDFIPQSEQPHHQNPECGFVSSANQVQTDSLYPYKYSGNFEYFRNRRINQRLSELSEASVEDMQLLQSDNHSLLAEEALPTMLEILNQDSVSQAGQQAVDLLEEWDYTFNSDQLEPVIFYEWWEAFYAAFWKDLIATGVEVDSPEDHTTMQFLLHADRYLDYVDKLPVHPTDLQATVSTAFKQTIETYCDGDCTNIRAWGKHKGTSIRHLMRLPAFSDMNLDVGGGVNIVNATGKLAGPSWRMVVDMSSPPKAYGVYPGGQSGNPGSKYYNDFTNHWANGQYFELKSSGDKETWEANHKQLQKLMP